MFSTQNWTFLVHQGALMSAEDIRDMRLDIPDPTMPFKSTVVIKQHDRTVLDLDTARLLRSVGTSCEYRIQAPQLPDIGQRRSYDWTFRPTLLAQLGSEPGQQLDEARLRDISTPILHFASCDFYEDELADNGQSVASFKIRVMQWGFVCLLSHTLRIDHGVAERREEVRLLHKFGDTYVQVEWSLREGQGGGGGASKVNKNLFI